MMKKLSKTPLIDEAKKYGLYHFDHEKPNDNDIIFKQKFKGDWDEELDKFKPIDYSYDFDIKNTARQWEEWINLDYDPKSFSKKMSVDSAVTPKFSKIVESVPFDKTNVIQSWITEQKPNQHIPYHVDLLTTAGYDPKVVSKTGYRMLVFLTDWWPGECMVWGTQTFTQWKAGWILGFPAMKYPHGTANVSHHTGFRLRISGLITDELKSWLDNDSIIEIS